MKPITLFVALFVFGFGLVACSSEDEPRKDALTHVEKPAPAVAPALPESKARLYRTFLVIDDYPFVPSPPKYVVDYGISTYMETSGMEIVNVEGRRELHFYQSKRYLPSLVEEQEQYLRYAQAYGDRKDSVKFPRCFYLKLVVNIDNIEVIRREANGQYTDVSRDYALVYNDIYDYVRTAPRNAYAEKYWRITPAVRRISDCDKRVCRWAFDAHVPVQIQPLETVKPDANTIIRVTLSNGQQIHTAWTDTARNKYNRSGWERSGYN